MDCFSLLFRFFFLWVFVFGITQNIFSQTQITVGKVPLSIVQNGSNIHVFCKGIDNNNNSIYEPDSGDIASSWWILDSQTQTVIKHREFTDRFLLSRHISSLAYNFLYVGSGNRVSFFNVNSQEMIEDTVVMLPDSLGIINGVNLYGGYIFVSSSKDSLKNGFVSALSYNGSGHGEIVGELTTLISPQQIIFYNLNTRTAVLCKGLFGTESSFLQLFTTKNSSINIPLGNGGNHILYQGLNHDSFYVCVTGSHKVVIVDLKKQEIVKTIPTGTTDNNGPRESVVIGKTLFVTTYNSDVREFNIETGMLTGILEPKGKPEGLTVINGKLWVTNAFKSKSSEAGNSITIFDSPLAVEEYFTENKNIVFPNPAQSSTTISTSFNGQANIPVQIEVYSLTGTKLLSVTTESGNNGEVHYTLPIKEYNLTSGTYFIRLSAANRVQTSRLTVVE